MLASGSRGNCYRISDGSTTLLLDAGIPFAKIRAGLDFQVTQVDGCLVSHQHLDHFKAVRDLAKNGINVYASCGTLAPCGTIHHRYIQVKAMQQFQIGTFCIMPFDVKHDAAEPLGYLCESTKTREKLLYFTDGCYSGYKFNGLTHIMCECNYDKDSLRRSVENGYISSDLAARIIRNHMSFETLVDMLKENDISRLQQIYLLHLSDSNSDEKRYKEEVQKLTGAEVYVC